MVKLFTFILLFFLITSDLSAYVHTLSSDGIAVKWNDNISTLLIYINSDPRSQSDQDTNGNTIKQIIDNSWNEWNNHSDISIVGYWHDSAPADGRNDLYFSSNNNYFLDTNTGVLGITQITYREATGEILETDIIINNNNGELLSASSSNYLANTVTHEFGHVFGLGHSEVKGSTMIFSAVKGQNTLSDDDIAGIYSIYPNGDKLGEVSGKIVGGESLIGILGTHVQAISLTSGKVVAGAFSDEEGNFSIKGLGVDDIYFLYIRPAKVLTALPTYYSQSQKDFCHSKEEYRGSFYQTCFSEDEGHPQGIELSNSNPIVNVGNVTVRCGMDVPSEYIASKNNYDVLLLDLNEKVGNMQTGFFTPDEIDDETADVYNINLDLSGLELSDDNIYLDFKILAQGLYSTLKFNMQIEDGDNNVISSVDFGLDSDGNPDLDVQDRIILSKVSENNYILRITPKSSISYSDGELYPNMQYFKDDLYFYFLMMNLTTYNQGSWSLYLLKDYSSIKDNTNCPDAPNSYKVKGYIPTTSSSETSVISQSDDDTVLNCSTVGNINNDNNGNGPLVFIFGFIISFIISGLLSDFKSFTNFSMKV